MKVQKRWSCIVFLLLHITQVTWTHGLTKHVLKLTRAFCGFFSERFQVVAPSSVVLAFAGEDVTLPTSLSPAISAQGFDVRWIRDDFDSPVLLYQNLQIRPERQIQSYKGRTTLFLEELLNGNVSLRLQDVRVSDSGVYRCFVDSRSWNEEAHITLTIEGDLVLFFCPFYVTLFYLVFMLFQKLMLPNPQTHNGSCPKTPLNKEFTTQTF
uniref:Ig-like domain-containing protein n=1 Tax=Erpetoichthys calabaricus TaxID=27687 RepID=A0A8C4TBT3_ERPCA